MLKLRNLLVIFFCSMLLSSCSKNDFPELRAQGEDNIYAEVLAEENATESVAGKEAVSDDGKVIIASVAAEKDKKIEIVSAVEELPKDDGVVIVASAAKEDSSNVVKTKPILKEKTKNSLLKKKNEKKFVEREKTLGKVLSDKQKEKLNTAPVVEITVEEIAYQSAVINNEPSITYQVDTFYFDNGSAVVKDKYKTRIKDIAKMAKEKNATIYVLGFASSRTNDTDYISHKMANFKASLSRAENVADAFIKAGVKEDKVLLEALSDSRPLYLEVMPEGERLNRRVEVYIGY